jgi:uncharacterized protein YjdB
MMDQIEKNIIPTYVFTQYNDDEDVTAFFESYNEMAQKYLDAFNNLQLPCWTSQLITGWLLDWIAQGIYGQVRPALQIVKEQTQKGDYNTIEYNSITYATISNYIAGQYSNLSDDLFKRVLTWNFYKGDGFQFSIPWFKRRIARFIRGVDGIDPPVDETFDISITSENGTFYVSIIDYGDGVAHALAACIEQEFVNLPFMYKYVVTVYKIVPVTGIKLSEDSISIIDGESRYIDVTIIPKDATNKEFTVTSSDTSIATVEILGNQIIITGGNNLGDVDITVTSTDGGYTATVHTRVVASAKFILRIDQLFQPLFSVFYPDLANPPEFTIDYGDGIDSKDYTIASDGTVLTTRNLTLGNEYTLTVKGEVPLNFYKSGAQTNNPLLEIIRIHSNRTDMSNFANTARSLRKIHSGAFDRLPNVVSMSSAFANCVLLPNIPNGLFKYCPLISNFYYTFFGCSSLTQIPDDIFSNNHNVTTFGYTFYGCTGLTSINTNIFAGCIFATNFAATFFNCNKIVSFASNLLEGCISASAFTSAFGSCSSLTSISGLWFKDCKNATDMSQVFNSCSSLKAIPNNLFAGLTKCTSYTRSFSACTGLETIGTGVFYQNTAAYNFGYCFSNCTSLKAIPGDLLSTASSISICQFMFEYCKALTTFPVSLFANNQTITNLTGVFQYCANLSTIAANSFDSQINTTGVDQMFRGTGITSIPAYLFSKCVKALNFAYCFGDCVKLTTINSRVFADCIGALGFDQTFRSCIALTTISSDIFYNCIKATSFNMTFLGCTSLIYLPSGLFDTNVAATTFANVCSSNTALTTVPNDIFKYNIKALTFNNAFYYCPLTSIPSFEGLTLVTDFASAFVRSKSSTIAANTFNGCAAVTTINSIFRDSAFTSLPAGLFDSMIKVTNLSSAFSGNTSLISVGYGIFDKCVAVNTFYGIFAACSSLTTDINNIFQLTAYPIVSSVATLFNSCALMPGSGLQFIAKMNYASGVTHIQALSGCYSLSDFNQIPTDWRG